MRLDALFTFIYPKLPGTPAASLPDPAGRDEKQAWFDSLLSLQNSISEEKHAAYAGTLQRVLVDGEEREYLTGRTDGGRLVRLHGRPELIGSFQNVRITHSNTWALFGELE